MEGSARSARLLTFAAPVVEAVVNGWVKLDPEVRSRLAGEGSSCIGVEFTELSVHIYVVLEQGAIRIRAEHEAPPTVWIRGRISALMSMMLNDVVRSDVVIEGDAELAARLHHAIRSVDVDWEEQLSRLTGDAIAHRVGETARMGLRWFNETRASVRADIKDYLTEEARMLPLRMEIERFLNEVDDLRSDVDRLEARIARLESRRGT